MAVNRGAELLPPGSDGTPLGAYIKADANGELIERIAYTPSDAVALAFDGWFPKPDGTAPAPAAAPPSAAETAPARELRGGTTRNR
ncbi:hypothetical protein [Actinoplanes sp. NPDC026623]|uniref:hypothetical protein n=1 Tax=Actinoplanes sp. NPDC026623 TaxID=3155610 RepID=UPI0033C0B6CC